MISINKICWQFLKKHLLAFLAIVVLVFTSAGCSLIMPQLSMQLIDKGLLSNNFVHVVSICGVTLIVVIIDQVSTIISSVIMLKINLRTKKVLYLNCFAKLLKIYNSIFDTKSPVRMVHELETDIGVVSSLIDRDTWMIVIQMFKFVGSVIGLFLINFQMTLLVCLYIPIKFLFSLLIIKNRKKLYKQYLQVSSNFQSIFGEVVTGILDINIFDKCEKKKERLEKDLDNLNRHEFIFSMYDRMNSSFERLLIQLIISSIYILGAKLMFGMDITVGALFAFISYSANLLSPISFIINVFYSILSKKPSIERILEFFDLPEKCDDGTLIQKIESIEYNNLSFSYEASKLILDQVSFKINREDKVAIVGDNGCGKSTIISILLGTYPCPQGNLSVNKVDLSNLSYSSMLSCISYACGKSYIFNDTVINNVCFREKYDSKKMSEIEKTCSASFINELPDKYSTMISANATTLSEGQKQKVLLMRALYKDSNLIILDESTSHMDKQSEEAFFSNFVVSYPNTLIFITHNPKLLSFADKIIFMSNGRIVDIADHAAPLSSNSIYKQYLISSNREDEK